MIDWINKTHVGDCRALMRAMIADGVLVNTCVTSPPYFGLRDYGNTSQLGLETTPEEFVTALVGVFGLVRELLSDDGTLWINLGDSYAGSWGAQSREKPGNQTASTLQGKSPLSARQIKAHPKTTGTGSLKNTPGLKPKDLIGIPWRVAFALQADGWYLRSDVIWHKPNPMPESVTDRPTKAHEYLFLLAKSERYFYNFEAIKEAADPKNNRTATLRPAAPGQLPHTGFVNGREYESRNRRSVWTIATQKFGGEHFATFPRALVEPCILAGSKPGGVILDPFMGSGTTAQVATDLGRQFIGCEINPAYVELHEMRSTTIGMPI